MAYPPTDGSFARVDFLELIAHELRQPLTAARGSLSMLLDPEREPRLEPEHRELLLGAIARNLDQLAALLQSLRVFSEADRGELEVVVGPTPVADLFRECAEDYPESRTRRRLRIESPTDLEIRVDRTLFKQVIANLVGNAIKFSPAGSLVTLSAQRGEGEVRIAVTDTGSGFPTEEKERIFERSVRLVHGASGLGLGLYVARAIVNAHQGSLNATSVVGRGSTFEVSIPA